MFRRFSGRGGSVLAAAAAAAVTSTAVARDTRWSGASADDATSPPPLFTAGTKLHGAGYGGLVDASSALEEPEHIMIYFSAHCK